MEISFSEKLGRNLKRQKVKYSKPPKPKEEEEEEGSRRRVTRGRQINYYDSLLMSDEEEEEEIKPKSRGKVMKGERAPSESSDYEESDDERKKRRGVSGGLGRGKVMKSEEEDEEEYSRKKKKLDIEENMEDKKKEVVEDTLQITQPVKADVTSLPPQNQTSVAPTPKVQTDGVPTVLTKSILSQEKKNVETQQPLSMSQSQTPPQTPVIQQSSQLQQIITRNPISSGAVVPQKVTSPRLPADITSRLPLTVTRLNTPTPGGAASTRPSFNPRTGTPNGARSTLPPVSSSISVIGGPSSSISITPVSFGNPRPPSLGSKGAPPASISVHSVSSAAALKTTEKPVEIPPAITISTKRGTAISGGAGTGNNASTGSPGPLPPVGKWSPHVIGSSNSGSATPPRPGATPVNSSPPPPYRSSPIPVTVSGSSTPLSTVAHRGTPPNLPSQTTSTPTSYSPYQSPEHFGSHPAFPSGFHPGSSHSPGPHGNQPRHSLLPSHPVHSSPSSVGSPSHAAAHARSVLLKQAYAGLEPLPYAGSPQGTPIDATRHNSPGPPINEAKEDQQQQTLPSKRLVEGEAYKSSKRKYPYRILKIVCILSL
ncbi:hypothetical protein Anas_06575 [Armadillidium nasatum]|uniref:Uncharacterized protein n=1 Tax=Armadillidium nasatum TaxID=96803 RepID=A0A5N5T9P3_9CRUS|nr:hypothetical protein Anas_06575 [Armadillidium nasatum]